MTDSTLTPPAADMMSFLSTTPEHKDSEYETPVHTSQRTELNVIVEDGPDSKLRLAEISAAANPLLAAARPLLCALAAMPAKLDAALVEPYRNLLVREMHLYQTLCDQANLRREHVLAVRYCLCTALDEAANNTTWGRRGVGAGKSLLVTFHGESEGGIKLFQIIGRLAASFQEHGNVLEVIYHLLGLGFEGRYSVQPDGRKQLDNIRQQLLTQLSQRRDPVMPALSPDFQGAISGRLRRMRRVPVWLSAGIALLAMLTLFGLYSHRMDVQTVTVQQHIDAIGIKLPPPPVPVHKLRQLRVDMPGWRKIFEGKRFLYELPWFMVVGSPGDGKTTALLNTGLQFPLAEQMEQTSRILTVPGGGTLHCDWWFTNEAVLIDTAGRYARHDDGGEASAAQRNAGEWQGFLGLLRKHRPGAPLNGVILTLNVADLTAQSPAERLAACAALRARLAELRETLGIRFPVYLVVTKMDLLPGFSEYFRTLTSHLRAQIWGFTLPYSRRRKAGDPQALHAACAPDAAAGSGTGYPVTGRVRP